MIGVIGVKVIQCDRDKKERVSINGGYHTTLPVIEGSLTPLSSPLSSLLCPTINSLFPVFFSPWVTPMYSLILYQFLLQMVRCIIDSILHSIPFYRYPTLPLHSSFISYRYSTSGQIHLQVVSSLPLLPLNAKFQSIGSKCE